MLDVVFSKLFSQSQCSEEFRGALGLYFSCMLRCTEKKLDKKNEKLALEIRKRKVETLERKKQILQLKAESEEIISTHHETFEFDDFSMTDDQSSIIPANNGRPISIEKPNTETLKVVVWVTVMLVT